jgi:hypothetical protein
MLILPRVFAISSTLTCGSFRMSSNPCLVRKTSGEALTTRFRATLDLLFQLGLGDLKGIDLCFAERE